MHRARKEDYSRLLNISHLKMRKHFWGLLIFTLGIIFPIRCIRLPFQLILLTAKSQQGVLLLRTLLQTPCKLIKAVKRSLLTGAVSISAYKNLRISSSQYYERCF